MMRDPITDAAQDPSCILAVTPDRGGSWWSRLRPPTPRNFAESPMTWPVFLQKLSEIALDDCEINLNLVPFQISKASVFWGIYFSSNNTQLVVNSGILTDNPLAVVLTPVAEKPISIVIKRVGNSVEIICDGTSKGNRSGNANDLSAAELGNAVSEFHGYFLSASLINLTTGETVWQAAYPELYDTSKPWPSDVPRNFAEETKTWYDFQNMQLAADWTHDYTFECTFMLHTRDTPAPVLYESAPRHMFGVYQYTDNTIGLFTALCKQTASANKYLGYIITAENATIFWESYHTVKIVVNGTSTSFYIDNELIRTYSSNYERTPKADLDLTAPLTKTGYIDNCFIQDDTTGKLIWSYPSEAERTRLLTNTNVRTDRGVFESPSSGVYRRIKTRLDLRGNSKSLTLVSRAFVPSHSADGKLYAAGLLTQGMFTSGPTSQVVAMSIWEDHRQTPSTLRLYTTASTSSNTEQGTSGVIPTTALDRWTTFAGVYDFELGTVTCYVDGVAVRTVNRGTLTAFGQGANSDLSDAVSLLHDLSNPILGMCDHKISWAMVFDRALTAAEIAALTPKKQPLSWAGIQDVVRRGRAENYFSVGDVLTVATPRWTIEYEVVGFDQVEPADTALTHSMTLLPVRLVTGLQFDAPEPGNPDANRAQYGCNRWDWSSIRQWMNSAAAPGEWWTAQHEYDASPSYAATMAGFMADLPADFLSAVAPARLTTALPSMDGGGSVETVDRFWLPSRTEIFGALDGEMSEGVQMTKYVDATDTDRIKYNVTGTALSWWLRTHSFGAAVRVQAVSASGTPGFNSAVSAYGVVPCCIIA